MFLVNYTIRLVANLFVDRSKQDKQKEYELVHVIESHYFYYVQYTGRMISINTYRYNRTLL